MPTDEEFDGGGRAAMADDTCWRELITEAMNRPTLDKCGRFDEPGTGDTWDDVVASVGNLDKRFDSGYGATEGPPFTLWTKRFVYFPVCYDGAESVGFVPRDPCDVKTSHWGGG